MKGGKKSPGRIVSTIPLPVSPKDRATRPPVPGRWTFGLIRGQGGAPRDRFSSRGETPPVADSSTPRPARRPLGIVRLSHPQAVLIQAQSPNGDPPRTSTEWGTFPWSISEVVPFGSRALKSFRTASRHARTMNDSWCFAERNATMGRSNFLWPPVRCSHRAPARFAVTVGPSAVRGLPELRWDGRTNRPNQSMPRPVRTLDAE